MRDCFLMENRRGNRNSGKYCLNIFRRPEVWSAARIRSWSVPVYRVFCIFCAHWIIKREPYFSGTVSLYREWRFLKIITTGLQEVRKKRLECITCHHHRWQDLVGWCRSRKDWNWSDAPRKSIFWSLKMTITVSSNIFRNRFRPCRDFREEEMSFIWEHFPKCCFRLSGSVIWYCRRNWWKLTKKEKIITIRLHPRPSRSHWHSLSVTDIWRVRSVNPGRSIWQRQKSLQRVSTRYLGIQ